MEIYGKSVDKNGRNHRMEYFILLAINNKMYKEGLITKEEKEEMDVEILREK